jgi:hypothetical protein
MSGVLLRRKSEFWSLRIFFSDTRQFTPGTHHGLFLIRLDSPSRINLIKRAEEVFRFEPIETWRGCFVVITQRKIRVRRTPQ